MPFVPGFFRRSRRSVIVFVVIAAALGFYFLIFLPLMATIATIFGL
jgi:hypothetical protein